MNIASTHRFIRAISEGNRPVAFEWLRALKAEDFQEITDNGETLGVRVLKVAVEKFNATKLDGLSQHSYTQIIQNIFRSSDFKLGMTDYGFKFLQNYPVISTEITKQAFISGVNSNDINLVKLALNLGFDPNFAYGRDAIGMIRHPLLIALQKNHTEIAELLMDQKYHRSPNLDLKMYSAEDGPTLAHESFKAAIKIGYKPMLVSLLNIKPTILAELDYYSPVVTAMKLGNSEIANFLIENGALDNGKIIIEESVSRKEYTALEYAISKGLYDVAKNLIKAGAKIDHSYNGESALLLAYQHNQLDLAELLISKGASFDFSDSKTCSLIQEIINSNDNADTIAHLDSNIQGHHQDSNFYFHTMDSVVDHTDALVDTPASGLADDLSDVVIS